MSTNNLSDSSVPSATDKSRSDSPSSAVIVSPAYTLSISPQSPVSTAQPQQSDLLVDHVDHDQKKLLVQHRAAATWGDGHGGWGDRNGPSDTWGSGVQSPKIVLLTAGRPSWTDPVIRCLPEAQHAHVPGPNFTLDELATCIDGIKSAVCDTKQAIDANIARMDAIKAEQEPL
ncbi:hypothetical protein AAF712_015838 [Marasmius tenuissimus]|uniref:Uncharacterized protein n=1 Tax=Marasmius tenuissimus TaxID=585030 RepID=A0ABR2Z8F6_9AGAR